MSKTVHYGLRIGVGLLLGIGLLTGNSVDEQQPPVQGRLPYR